MLYLAIYGLAVGSYVLPLTPGSGLSVAPIEMTLGRQAIDIIEVLFESLPEAAITATLAALSASTSACVPAGTPQLGKIFPCETFTATMLYLALLATTQSRADLIALFE